MSAALLRIVWIVGLILLAGFFSLSRFALAAARKSLLRERAGRGDRRADAALRLGERKGPVAAALRLGTALSVAFGGIAAGLWLAGKDDSDPVTAPWLASCLAAGLALALAVFLAGDQIARRLAQHEPERRLAALSGPIRAFSIAAGPLVGASDWLSRKAVQALRIPAAGRPRLSQEELMALLEDGAEGGTFERAEVEIFKRAFRFCDRRARTIMTPRSEVVWIDLNDSPEEVRRKVVSTPHSRFPVCDQSLDNLLGIVQVKDLLAQRTEGPMFRVKGFLTLPAFIFEGTKGPQILEILKTSSTHIAVVLDEYGSVVGLLTLNDILENVLGDLPEDQGEVGEAAVVDRPDGSRLIDGRFPIDEFRDLYGLAALPEGDYHTLAGLVVTQLGHIPSASEALVLQGLRMEVVEMNANRVVRVLVRSANGTHEPDGPAHA